MSNSQGRLIILLSGPVSAGKTTLARALAETLQTVRLISSRRILEGALDSEKPTRKALQMLGERLDRETGGRWLVDAVLEDAASEPVLVIDAVRTKEQIELLRTEAAPTLHVHVHAAAYVLAARYETRRAAQPELELPSYESVLLDRTEAHVPQLISDADLSLDTGFWSRPACARVVTEAARTLLGRDTF